LLRDDSGNPPDPGLARDLWLPEWWQGVTGRLAMKDPRGKIFQFCIDGIAGIDCSGLIDVTLPNPRPNPRPILRLSAGRTACTARRLGWTVVGARMLLLSLSFQ
jgi:hypothetical protein